jgi:O-acetylserine/cysteine efflux transporter
MDHLVYKGVLMSPLKVACAILVPFLWGLQFVVIKLAVAAFPPLFLLGLRFAFIAALLLPFAGLPSRAMLRPVILISIFMGGLNFSFAFLGLAHGSASVAGVVMQLYTPFAVLLAWPLLGDRPSIRVIAGVAIAFAGIALTSGGSGGSLKWLPTLLIAGSAFSLAVGSILVKRHGPFEPMKLLAWMSLLIVPQVLAASAMVEHGQIAALHAAPAIAWLALLYLVLFGGILGFGLWFWLIATSSMAKVAPYALLQTVFAVAAGVVLLGEPLTARLVAGMLICIAGVVLTQRPAARPITPAVKCQA